MVTEISVICAIVDTVYLPGTDNTEVPFFEYRTDSRKNKIPTQPQ